MNVLTFNWHTPYLWMLARLDHRFDVAPPNRSEAIHLEPWHEKMRPLPPNVTPITGENAVERLKDNNCYDLVLAHNVGDLVFTKEFSIPKLIVFHTKLLTEAHASNKPDIIPAYRKAVRELVSGVYCVFIAQTKRYDWGLPGEVIMPGIDTSQYGGYTGEIAAVLRVGNLIKPRDLTSGYSIQEEVLRFLPNIVVGDNQDIPGARPSRDWEDLKKKYRENRLFLNTNLPPWEDGYNLAMLEAMATGMPVVSLANPVSPLTDGRDALVAADASGLRAGVEELLGDIDLARTVGAEGKRTVERIFPIDRFLEKWDAAIRRAYSWHPHKPKNIFGQEKPEKRGPVSFLKGRKKALDILLSYTSHPATAAAFLDRAFDGEGHNLLTAGSRLTPSIISGWNLQGLKDKAKKHDIITPDPTVDMDYVLKRVPRGFNPDFFLWVETGLDRPPENLEKLAIPKAAWLIFTHLRLAHHIKTAKMFDVVFLSQRAYIPDLKKHGVENVYWLPLACDPQIHGKAPMTKEHDIGFVGSLEDERRVSLLRGLAGRVDVGYRKAFLREMADHYCRSRIVFNSAEKLALGMRVFEAMCAGSMLLTDHAQGMSDFFEDRKHLVVYEDEELIDVARYYLAHEAERENIAETGRQEVLKNHTYGHRARDVVRVMAV